MWMPGPSLMARATALRAVGGYREKFLAAEDRDICWRLGALGPTHRLLEVLVHWRLHDANASLTKHRIQLASHALGDLSAVAHHLGRSDDDILAAVKVGGDYVEAINNYAILLGDKYPVETYWYYFLMRFRGWQLSGEPTEAALLKRIRRHVLANPLDWRRLKVARRVSIFSRRDRATALSAAFDVS
jgi:hypothetical protein